MKKAIKVVRFGKSPVVSRSAGARHNNKQDSFSLCFDRTGIHLFLFFGRTDIQRAGGDGAPIHLRSCFVHHTTCIFSGSSRESMSLLSLVLLALTYIHPIPVWTGPPKHEQQLLAGQPRCGRGTSLRRERRLQGLCLASKRDSGNGKRAMAHSSRRYRFCHTHTQESPCSERRAPGRPARVLARCIPSRPMYAFFICSLAGIVTGRSGCLQ